MNSYSVISVNHTQQATLLHWYIAALLKTMPISFIHYQNHITKRHVGFLPIRLFTDERFRIITPKK